MSQNIPGLPVLKSYSKHNETMLYTYVASRSLYTHRLLQIRGPAHKVNRLNGRKNARTRATVKDSMEKKE